MAGVGAAPFVRCDENSVTTGVGCAAAAAAAESADLRGRDRLLEEPPEDEPALLPPEARREDDDEEEEEEEGESPEERRAIGIGSEPGPAPPADDDGGCDCIDEDFFRCSSSRRDAANEPSLGPAGAPAAVAGPDSGVRPESRGELWGLRAGEESGEAPTPPPSVSGLARPYPEPPPSVSLSPSADASGDCGASSAPAPAAASSK